MKEIITSCILFIIAIGAFIKSYRSFKEKGYYQPVYTFSVSWDDIEHTINVPAIQK